MTVGGFSRFVAAMRGMTGAKARDRLAELVERIELAEVWNRRIEAVEGLQAPRRHRAGTGS